MCIGLIPPNPGHSYISITNYQCGYQVWNMFQHYFDGSNIRYHINTNILNLDFFLFVGFYNTQIMIRRLSFLFLLDPVKERYWWSLLLVAVTVISSSVSVVSLEDSAKPSEKLPTNTGRDQPLQFNTWSYSIFCECFRHFKLRIFVQICSKYNTRVSVPNPIPRILIYVPRHLPLRYVFGIQRGGFMKNDPMMQILANSSSSSSCTKPRILWKRF